MHWQNNFIEDNTSWNRDSHAVYTLKWCDGVLLKTRYLSDKEASWINVWINVYGWRLYENIIKHISDPVSRISYIVYEDSDRATDTDKIVT